MSCLAIQAMLEDFTRRVGSVWMSDFILGAPSPVSTKMTQNPGRALQALCLFLCLFEFCLGIDAFTCDETSNKANAPLLA